MNLLEQSYYGVELAGGHICQLFYTARNFAHFVLGSLMHCLALVEVSCRASFNRAELFGMPVRYC
jgi:hypothetical protein